MRVGAALTLSAMAFLVTSAFPQTPAPVLLDIRGDPLPTGAIARLGTLASAAPDRSDGLDLLGDPLPPEALARFGTVRLVQGCRAYCMALSPDGKLLATGGEDGTLRVWDTASGKELCIFTKSRTNRPSVP